MPNIISEIEALVTALAALQPMKQEYRSKLDKKLRLEFNYNSNHLEGNTLTYSETELLLIFDETKGSHTLREYEEMKAHDVALQLVKEWAADPETPLTEATIKNLNKVILVTPFWKDAITPDGQQTRRLIKVGDYKAFPNSVRLSNGEIFEYASVADTPILMGELVQWYKEEEQKKELHPVAIAALLHYKFVRIHPFDDGNGRISRLLMNYVLLKNNLPPVIIRSADKRNYLFALNSADAGDLDTFINYIAQQLIWSLELSIKAAKGESIEEPGDLEKEIAVWKKQAVLQVPDAMHRNDHLIYTLYTNTIKEMFKEFVERHEQFHELFFKTVYSTFTNFEEKKGTEWQNNMENGIVLIPEPLFYNENEIPEGITIDSTYRKISANIKFQDYKYNEKNPFSISSQLSFQFKPYKYEVVYANKQIEKNYGEFLTADEKEQIINDSIKAVFAEIKESSGHGKKEFP